MSKAGRKRAEKSPAAKFVSRMDRVARCAIGEVGVGFSDFIKQARASYREQHAIIKGARIKAAARAREEEALAQAEWFQEREEDQ
jgi:hypothetical protein